MSKRGQEKREAFINAAYFLFEKHGFHATGVDAIAERAESTKRTLYRIFGSKENLALEVIRRHDEDFRRHVRTRIQQAEGPIRERILSLFDYYGEWFAGENFQGCLFIKALVEFHSESCILRDAAREAKTLLKHYLAKLCEELDVADSAKTASQLQILLEGSIIATQAAPGSDSAKIAREIAELVIDTNSRS